LSGIMYECVRHNVPYVLPAASATTARCRTVVTDVLAAQDAMRG